MQKKPLSKISSIGKRQLLIADIVQWIVCVPWCQWWRRSTPLFPILLRPLQAPHVHHRRPHDQLKSRPLLLRRILLEATIPKPALKITQRRWFIENSVRILKIQVCSSDSWYMPPVARFPRKSRKWRERRRNIEKAPSIALLPNKQRSALGWSGINAVRSGEGARILLKTRLYRRKLAI